MIFSYHAVPTEEEMFFIGRPHLSSLFLVFRELLCYDILVKLCAFSPGFKWMNA